MNPVAAASRWSHWTVSANCSHFIDALDANLPSGWTRLPLQKVPVAQLFSKDAAFWYECAATPTSLGVKLGLEQWKGTELRGGKLLFSTPANQSDTATIEGAWDQIMRFLDEGIVRAARLSSARFSLPTPSEAFHSELPSDVSEKLREFSASSRKTLPLNHHEATLWREFILVAFRSRTVIDSDSFVNWLVDNGWPLTAAQDLILRFNDQVQLLSSFADEVSAV